MPHQMSTGTSSADGDHDMTHGRWDTLLGVWVFPWASAQQARSPPGRGLPVHQRFGSFPHLCPETFPQKDLLVPVRF